MTPTSTSASSAGSRWFILVLGPAGRLSRSAIAKGFRFRLPDFWWAPLFRMSASGAGQKVVDVARTASPKQRSHLVVAARFALLIAAGYVIVKYLEVTPVAVFLGLLVSAAAVVISIIYELRTQSCKNMKIWITALLNRYLAGPADCGSRTQ